MPKVTNLIYSQWSAQRYAAGEKCRTQRVINWPKWVTNAFKHGEKRVFEYAAERLNKWGRIMGPPDVKKKKIPEYKCPYGQPGDRLNLLTEWAVSGIYDEVKPSDLDRYLKTCRASVWTAFDGPKSEWFGRTRRALYMPKWLRDLMPKPKILCIEARRVQDIIEEECNEEGIERIGGEYSCTPWRNYLIGKPGEMKLHCSCPIRSYQTLFDSINAKRGYPWKLNPWVWNIRHQSAEELRKAS